MKRLTHFVTWVEWKKRSSGASIHVGNCFTLPPEWPCRAPGARLLAPALTVTGPVAIFETGEWVEGVVLTEAAAAPAAAAAPWPEELARADTPYSSGVARKDETFDLDIADIPGKWDKKEEAFGVGLPDARAGIPDRGAKMDRGDVTPPGLSRADRLWGGADIK